jgi:type II secretory pathway component PulF
MPRLSPRAKALIYSNLEKYARSGMGMEKACESLLRQPRVSGNERRLYRGLLDGIKRGRSIGDALGGAGGFVTPLEHEVVVAAESGGKLEKGFAHLAEYFRRIDRTRKKILKGLAYPLFLIHLAIPVSTLAVTAFGSFRLDGSGAEGGIFQRALETSGWTMLAVWGVLLAVILLGWLLTRLGRRSAAVDRLLRLVPLLGSVRLFVSMERFTQVFEIFLLAGRTMSESLSGAARASGSGLIRAAGKRGAAIVAAGDPLAHALLESPEAFPDDFTRGMIVAEESGVLDRELAEWGRYYSESAGEAMEQLAEWAPKLFYWGILILVGALIVRAGFAYRDLLESIINLEG